MAAEGDQTSIFTHICQKVLKAEMVTDINLVPVVYPGPFEMSVIDPETERVNQMQSDFSGPAQAGDVPCVSGYFGLVKDHMEVGILERSVPYLGDIIRHGKITILPHTEVPVHGFRGSLPKAGFRDALLFEK